MPTVHQCPEMNVLRDYVTAGDETRYDKHGCWRPPARCDTFQSRAAMARHYVSRRYDHQPGEREALSAWRHIRSVPGTISATSSRRHRVLIRGQQDPCVLMVQGMAWSSTSRISIHIQSLHMEGLRM